MPSIRKTANLVQEISSASKEQTMGLGQINTSVTAVTSARWDLTERQRTWMAWRIALPLMFKLKPKYDQATFTYEGFLEELLAKYTAKQRFLN